VEAIDQRIDGGQAVFFRNIGQMGISCGGRGAGMTEKNLDMTKAQAAFKQMGCETVAEGVNRDFFNPALCHDRFHGGLDPTAVHVREGAANPLGETGGPGE